MRTLAAVLTMAALGLCWYALWIWDSAQHGGSPLRMFVPRSEEQLSQMMATEFGPGRIVEALQRGRDGYRFLDEALMAIGMISALLMLAACIVFAFGSATTQARAKQPNTEASTKPR